MESISATLLPEAYQHFHPHHMLNDSNEHSSTAITTSSNKLNTAEMSLKVSIQVPSQYSTTTTSSISSSNTRSDDDASNPVVHQKKQQARRRNAMYSKRKYYKKKQFVERLRENRLQLLGKNQILRKSNEQLEEIIQRSLNMIAMKKMIQAEETQREILHLSVQATPPPFHTTSIQSALLNHSIFGTRPVATSSFVPRTGTSYFNQNSLSRNVFHGLNTSNMIGNGSLSNWRDADLFALNPSSQNGLHNTSFSTTMNSSHHQTPSQSSLLTPLFLSASMKKLVYSSQMLQQGAVHPYGTSLPPSVALLRNNKPMDIGLSHLIVPNYGSSTGSDGTRNDVASKPSSAAVGLAEPVLPLSPMRLTITDGSTSSHFCGNIGNTNAKNEKRPVES